MEMVEAIKNRYSNQRKKVFKKFEKLFLRPAIVQVDLTNKCNLNCIYCYNKLNRIDKRDLSDKEMGLLISKIIKELNPLNVVFSGGEPLLRARLLFKSANLLKKHGISVHLNTNGLLVNEKIAQKIAKVGISQININIDSFKQQDYLRGKINLIPNLFHNLDILKRYYPPKRISISCVVNKLDYREIPEIAKFVKKNGFKEIHLLDMIPCREPSKMLMLSKKEWLTFFKIYQDLKKIKVKVKLNHALLFLGEFENKVKIPFCMAGRFKMVITAGGKIVPCNYFKTKDFVCGDVLKDNLLNVWQNSPLMNKFRYFIPKDKMCQECKLLNLCTGGCRALAFKMSGNAFVGDPYCLLYHLKDETKR